MYKITFNGILPAGDAFQHGWFADVPVDGDHLISDVAGAADAALTAFLTSAANLKGYYQPETIWSPPLVELMNETDGSVLDSLNGTVTLAGDRVGGVNLPGEVACCTTFRTAELSASGRGRSYLPAPGTVALTNNGRFTSAFTGAVVQAWYDCFVAFVGDPGGGVPVVWSNKNDALYEITAMECGDVPDAQRRRRNGLTEVRTGISFP